MKSLILASVIVAGIGAGVLAGHSKWVVDSQVAAGEWKIEMQAPPCDDVTHNVQVLFPKRSGEPITIECDAMPVGEK